MRFFETIDGNVKNEWQIKDILFVIYGEKITDKRIMDFHIEHFAGIKREITDLTEWKKFASTSKVGAMMLYRELTGLGLKEAKLAVENYVDAHIN